VTEGEFEGPVVRDKRRIDPVTGQLREPQATAAPGPDAGTPQEPSETETMSETESITDKLEQELAERTADLQRLQAEYVNYKKRVDRDREAVREQAVASTLASLLPVLDDIGRAREHDELTGGFRAVAESFERIVAGLGLNAFGAVGDEFDPRIHEALMHRHADDADGPRCEAILQVGYRYGDRIVRPARVAVVEPSQEAVESAILGEPPLDDAAAEQRADDDGQQAAGDPATGED